MSSFESDQRYSQHLEVEVLPPHHEVYSYIRDAFRGKRSYRKARMESRSDEVTFPLGRGMEYTVYEKKEEGRTALQVRRGREGSSTTVPLSVLLLDIYPDNGALVISHTIVKGKGKKTEITRGLDGGIDGAKADIRHTLRELFPLPRRQSA